MEDMPGHAVKIARLSDRLLPTAISKKDGTIIFNENFVKVIHKLAGHGLRREKDRRKHGIGLELAEAPEPGRGSPSEEGSRGDIGGEYDDTSLFDPRGNESGIDPFLGNVYWSVLYSIILHETRGHFRIEKGEVVFSPDEKYVRGDRGRSNLYVNLIAICYLWFRAAEGGTVLRRT